MKPYKTIKGALARIEKLKAENPDLSIKKAVYDDSVTAEIRLNTVIVINYNFDWIKRQKGMSEEGLGIARTFDELQKRLIDICQLAHQDEMVKQSYPSRSKTALAERKQFINTTTLSFYNECIVAIMAAKHEARKLPNVIKSIQNQQQRLLKMKQKYK